jgi:hypothetical protein
MDAESQILESGTSLLVSKFGFAARITTKQARFYAFATIEALW